MSSQPAKMSLLGESIPDPPSESGGTLGLVTLETPKYSKKEVAIAKDTVLVLLEIQAASLTPVREGLDLVAVLDVSGSMKDEEGGQKLSKMKKAMEFLILKLAPADRLSIVTFATGDKKLCGLRSMKADAKPAIQTIIRDLKAEGGTNIAAGLKTALAIIRGRKYSQGRTANIFLMSDGRQTDADKAEDVDAGEVPVYTFGIGKDADCVLLSTIAGRSRGGTFSTVKDGAELTKPFADLLGGTLTVVAQDVMLTLTPFEKDKPRGLEDMNVDSGLAYKTDKVEATGEIIINFGNLFREEKRTVVVEITLKDASRPVIPAPAVVIEDYDEDDEDAAEIAANNAEIAKEAADAAAAAAREESNVTFAEAKLTYTAQGKSSTTNGQANKQLTILRTLTPTSAIDSAAQEVLSEVARLQHAVLIREARLKADQNLFGEAKDKLMDGLNNVENILVNDGGKMVGILRNELLHLLDLMKSPELYVSEGRPFALACESSHGCQRYAGRGEGDGIRTFCTARMDTYLKQAIDFLQDEKTLPPSAQEDEQKEIAANPTAAFSPELASYLMTAIEALQAMHKIITKPKTSAVPL